MLEWCYQFLSSKKLTIALFLVICPILIPGTLTETESPGLEWLRSITLILISINILLCTVRRFRALSIPVIIIHAGTLLTFAGAVITTFGYVATVNIYEGTSVDKVYRWDIEKDVDIGVDLMVKKINVEYYPIPIKVGVLKGEEKFALFELKTGESFELGEYTVRADSLEVTSKNLNLTVMKDDAIIGSADTAGINETPEEFPYGFKLVAFKDPSLFRMWVDLALLNSGEVMAEGTSEVNGPLHWGKHNYYFTKTDADAEGKPYAGIQISYDPGVPYVYSGFVVLIIGCLMYMQRKLYGYR